MMHIRCIQGIKRGSVLACEIDPCTGEWRAWPATSDDWGLLRLIALDDFKQAEMAEADFTTGQAHRAAEKVE
jgi:hypothetical protein